MSFVGLLTCTEGHLHSDIYLIIIFIIIIIKSYYGNFSYYIDLYFITSASQQEQVKEIMWGCVCLSAW